MYSYTIENILVYNIYRYTLGRGVERGHEKKSATKKCEWLCIRLFWCCLGWDWSRVERKAYRHSLDSVHLDGGGHVVDDGIEEGLHTLVLEGGSGEDGHELEGQGADTQTPFQRLHRWLLALRIRRMWMWCGSWLVDRSIDQFGVVLYEWLSQRKGWCWFE